MEKRKDSDWCNDNEENGFDAIVVGSGYGGSVAACRLSMAGITVCLIEKGRKWEAEDFPVNSLQMMSATRIQSEKWGVSFGQKTALFQLYEQDDSLAGVVCGLGGGSLVNAGVMAPTPARTRRNPKWPQDWERDWELCEASASAMLRPQSVPVEFASSKIMRDIVEDEIEECSSSSIKLSINFGHEEPILSGSKPLENCLACGNCLAGCPYNAKNSTDKNYIASAVQAGCVVKTDCQVRYIVKNPEDFKEGCSVNRKHRRRWRVYLDDVEYYCSDFVILSAGVFGTTEILFQSERRGLRVSEKLGFGFSCNGNNVAYVAGSPAPLNAYGLDKKQFSNIPFQERPGPAITTSHNSLGFTIQSAILPTAYPYIIFKGIVSYGWPAGYWLFHGIIDKIKHLMGLKASQAVILNAMGYDDGDGRVTVDKKTDKICFTPPHDPLLSRKIQNFQKLAKKLRGILFMSKYRSTSVHLLGGCNAASDSMSGVCNPNGQVFDPNSSTSIHPGLYVCDASLIPCSIGINPSLTIAIVAEHISRHLVLDVLKYKGFTKQIPDLVSETQANADKEDIDFVDKAIDSKRKSVINKNPDTNFSFKDSASGLTDRKNVKIRETMRGWIGGMPCTAHLIMKMGFEDLLSSDAGKIEIGESHPLLRGRVGGYIVLKAVEKDKLYIIDGKVDMCKIDRRTPYTQYMHYKLLLASAAGSRYILEGKKIMNPYLFTSYVWRESRTMHVTLRTIPRGNEMGLQKLYGFTPDMPELKGELSLSTMELLRSIITVEGKQRGRFISLLLQSISRTYILKIPRRSSLELCPSTMNQRPYPSSQLHEIRTEDGFTISCRQWRCNQNTWRYEQEIQSCPVLLLNGYSTESFWLPTEPKDLVRTLLEEGYETWLLQPRLHPLHPSNDFTIEDIAKFDIPAAIGKICELHGQFVKLHVIAHCVGGLAIHISLLGGFISANHIASLTCTNSSMFFKLTTSSLVKMWLPLIPITGLVLGKNRVMSMFESSKDNPRHQFIKIIARLIPRYERCICDECEIFSGIFGNAFWHENISLSMHHFLNKQSFSRLPMAGFPHLRKICNAGFIVNPEGKNVYLVHPERMTLPTFYISGGRSLLVTPETSFLANQFMRLHQPGFQHKRMVIEDFGHSDLLIGEQSYRRVFPHIISHMKSIEQSNHGLHGKEGKYKKEPNSWEHLQVGNGGFGAWIYLIPVLMLIILILIYTF